MAQPCEQGCKHQRVAEQEFVKHQDSFRIRWTRSACRLANGVYHCAGQSAKSVRPAWHSGRVPLASY